MHETILLIGSGMCDSAASCTAFTPPALCRSVCSAGVAFNFPCATKLNRERKYGKIYPKASKARKVCSLAFEILQNLLEIRQGWANKSEGFRSHLVCSPAIELLPKLLEMRHD